SIDTSIAPDNLRTGRYVRSRASPPPDLARSRGPRQRTGARSPDDGYPADRLDSTDACMDQPDGRDGTGTVVALFDLRDDSAVGLRFRRRLIPDVARCDVTRVPPLGGLEAPMVGLL